eukprot:1336905-Rhodomonas_salina.1
MDGQVLRTCHGPKGLCHQQERVSRQHSVGSTRVSWGYCRLAHLMTGSDNKTGCSRQDRGLRVVALKAPQCQFQESQDFYGHWFDSHQVTTDSESGESDGGGRVETASQDGQFNYPHCNEELADIDMLEPDPPNRQAAMKNISLRPFWMQSENLNKEMDSLNVKG